MADKSNVKYDKDGNIILCPDLYDKDPDKYHVNTSSPKPNKD